MGIVTPDLPVAPEQGPKRPKLVRILGPLIRDHIDAKNREQDRAARSWHASRLGSTCGRQLWYDRNGYAKERWIDPQYSRDGDAGTALHEVYQGYLESLGIVNATELPIGANVYEVGGRIDVEVGGEVARFVGEGEKGLIEIKTMKDEHWREMPDHYKYFGYFTQIQIYLALRPDLARALLLCVNRNDSRMREFIVERDTEWGDHLLAKAAYLTECFNQGILPDAEPSNLCNWCPYQNQCEGDDILNYE